MTYGKRTCCWRLLAELKAERLKHEQHQASLAWWRFSARRALDKQLGLIERKLRKLRSALDIPQKLSHEMVIQANR